MNTSRVIAFVVASIVSTATIIGAQAASSRPQGAARAGHAANGGKGQNGLLRGVKLSDTEKAKLKEIHGSYRTRTQALRESLKPAMQDARAARQKGDTASVRAVLERTSGDRATFRALMERQRTDLRAALSPEHQTQFDANVRQVNQRHAAKAKHGRASKAHGRRGGRGIGGRIPNV